MSGPQGHWYGRTLRSLVWADLKVIGMGEPQGHWYGRTLRSLVWVVMGLINNHNKHKLIHINNIV